MLIYLSLYVTEFKIGIFRVKKRHSKMGGYHLRDTAKIRNRFLSSIIDRERNRFKVCAYKIK